VSRRISILSPGRALFAESWMRVVPACQILGRACQELATPNGPGASLAVGLERCGPLLDSSDISGQPTSVGGHTGASGNAYSRWSGLCVGVEAEITRSAAYPRQGDEP